MPEGFRSFGDSRRIGFRRRDHVGEHFDEGVGCGQHVVVFVRQAHMQADDPSKIRMPGAEGRHDRGHRHEATDVDVADAAADRLTARGEVGKEMAVVLLEIGVGVPPGFEHQRHVSFEPALGVVVAVAADHVIQLDGEPRVERILTSGQKLVVMNASLPPESRLVAEDVEL